MLAVFEKSVGNPPEELRLPETSSESSKSREEIGEIFRARCPDSTFYNLPNSNFMALSHQNENPLHPRSIVVMDDVFCIFTGGLENICELRRHYGLSRHTTEAMLVVEVYKVLRDRAPYPCDQVIKDLVGKFAFVLFDSRRSTLFAARYRDGSVEFNWGVAGDGSLVCSDDGKIVSEACGNCCANFPPGCIFMNGSGLVSFVHPLHKVRAVARKDDNGRVTSAIFQVDLYTRLPSIPRKGSAANWADSSIVKGDKEKKMSVSGDS